MKPIQVAMPSSHLRRHGVIFLLAGLLLTGCALPQPPVRPTLYDFGPGPLEVPAQAPAGARPLVLLTVEVPPALDGQALLYRLAYADAQQLRPYAHARWSMSPAQLVQQRLRERLSRQGIVLDAADGVAGRSLRVELEEFSQVFDAPTQSSGLVRLRATLIQPGAERPLSQRNIVVRLPAPTADAPGGVRALTAATDAAVGELADWLGARP